MLSKSYLFIAPLIKYIYKYPIIQNLYKKNINIKKIIQNITKVFKLILRLGHELKKPIKPTAETISSDIGKKKLIGKKNTFKIRSKKNFFNLSQSNSLPPTGNNKNNKNFFKYLKFFLFLLVVIFFVDFNVLFDNIKYFNLKHLLLLNIVVAIIFVMFKIIELYLFIYFIKNTATPKKIKIPFYLPSFIFNWLIEIKTLSQGEPEVQRIYSEMFIKNILAQFLGISFLIVFYFYW